MKKFWEKYDLVKIAGIMALFTVLLTWLIPQGQWQGTELVVNEISRVGIFDFFTYGLLGMYYFTVLVTFLFVLGGFYQVLSKTGGYQKLTNSIAKIFKDTEIIFVIIVSFIIAALTAIINDYFVIIAFIPFFITILSKMKLDKITGVATTFGAMLVGILGSIYNTKITGVNVMRLGAEYKDFIWVKLVIFFVAFALFTLFNILHIVKTNKNKKADLIEETFVSKEVTKKDKVWPIAVIFLLFIIITIMAYLPWQNAFNIEIFDKATEWFTTVEIFGAPVFGYIFGTIESFGAFGSWDLFGVQTLMLIASLFIKWIYKIEWNEYFTAFGEGLKKSGKFVIILLIVYNILEFTVMFPVLPTIIDWIMSLTSKFNVVLSTFAGLIASMFTVEYQYTVQLVGSYLTTTYADFAKQIPVMLQATYGLISFVTPASAILLLGLSYTDVSYKDWFKYIWKFVLAMFVIIVVLMLIIF